MLLCTQFVSPSAMSPRGSTHLEICPAPAAPVEPTDPGAKNALARLVELIQSNDRLLADLKVLDRRLADAKQYVASPGANLLLGRSRIERIRDQRSLVMTALRSNRIVAREFLSSPVS